MSNDATPWWKSAVIYQIYPRSFADGGVGEASVAGEVSVGEASVGDLRGIIDRLEHLSWLGVDAIWLSPVFRSPMADFGYDVSDFCDIDPVFGTLADLDQLVAACHARGLKLILDWVPNHTSIEHPWFQESRRDRTNPKADWYVWRDEPANNWKAAFPKGESVWHWDEPRSQYYLRCFAKEQPDLNWDNPEVEAAMLDTLRFWLDRGIDGFRMDVVHLIGKDLFKDDPADAVARNHAHVTFNDAEVTHERLRAIRRVLDAYPGDRTSVGEVYLLDIAAMSRYHGAGDELHMSFNFAFLWAPPEPRALRDRIALTLRHVDLIDAWPTWVLSNHDVVRHRQRHGGDENVARMMAVMLLTLRGTPFVYQGEELGLLDAVVPPERIVDLDGRDGCRAPIPWDPSPLHGWPADPWLPFPPEGEERNVTTLRDDPKSILHLYRDLLTLRRAEADLQRSELTLLDLGDDVLAYRRGDGWMVVVNLGEQPVTLGETVHVAISSDRGTDGATIDAVSGRTAVVARREV